MNDPRIDLLARVFASPLSRRWTLRTFAAAVFTAAEVARWPASTAAVDSTCREGGKRCQGNSQCCSQRCRKRRKKNRGRCKSLGPFAANCPKVEACFESGAGIRCLVGETIGGCTPTASGAPFCFGEGLCNNSGAAVCATDADCVTAMSNSRAKCLPCAGSVCFGDVLCVVYAGDVIGEP